MKLNLYKDNNLVTSVNKNEEGSTKVTINGLTPNTDYPEGAYKLSWANDSGESEKVNVPSFKTLKIVLKSLVVNADKTEVTVGDTVKLSTTFNPTNATDKNVVYSVDKSSVATVDNKGVVTAKAPGQVKVTATVGEVTSSVNITVKEAIPKEPENIEVSPGTDSTEVSV